MSSKATHASSGDSDTSKSLRSSPRKKDKEDANVGEKASDASKEPQKPAKKESFKWNTPADEFAHDVASDAEEDEDDYDDHDRGSPYTAEIDGQQFEAHRTADGGVVIQLGSGSGDNSMISEKRSPSKIEESGRKKKKKEKEKEKYKCPKCDKVWNWPWELRRHVLTHYKEKEREETATYKCSVCSKGFQWKRDLAQHMRLHTGEKLLVCSVCEKKFTTRQALLHHVVVHTGEKPFQCALCGNRFTQPANLRTHMKKKHGSSGLSGNKCPHCSEPFPSIIALHQHILEDHQQIVAEEREEQIMEKMKKEQMKAERERLKEENRRKRAEKRKDKIDYNDFRAKGLQEWEINYEFHIGEGLVRGVDWDRTPSNGEIECEICNRKFGWRYEIMFHNLCHKTDEHGNTRNKVCPECDTAFKVPIGLKHHLLLHTGETPFLCLHCWRSFSSHIDLKLHIRKEHLSHLDPQNQDNQQEMSSKKSLKTQIENATPTSTKKMAKRFKAETGDGQQMQHVTFVNQDGTPLTNIPENLQMMVANQEGGENQTILVNSDGTIVQTGDQDMIVVIQSEDFDQSQGVIVVDPGQLQQVVGSDGVPMTLVEAGDTMILGESGSNATEGKQIVVRPTTTSSSNVTADAKTGSNKVSVVVSTASTTASNASENSQEDNSQQITNGESAEQMIVSDNVEQGSEVQDESIAAEEESCVGQQEEPMDVESKADVKDLKPSSDMMTKQQKAEETGTSTTEENV